MPSYGQMHAPEPWHNLAFLHRHEGGALREVAHEIPLGVLEQENFGAQGITVAKLVPGASAGTDALGNCVFNAGTAAVSFLGLDVYSQYLEKLGIATIEALAFSDTKSGEEAAIVAYHEGTDLTGTPSQEWPPTDCGSSGVYLVQFLQKLGIVSGQKIAHGAQNVVSLLQTAPVCLGGPFFNSWEEPGPLGMIDGNGTSIDLENAIRSGVAGGHETLIFAIDKLTLTATGQVTPGSTVLRVRNSWGSGWGDAGCYRVHLSTYVALGGYMDFRSLVA